MGENRRSFRALWGIDGENYSESMWERAIVARLVIAYSASTACKGCAWKVPMQPRSTYSWCCWLHFFHVTKMALWRMEENRV